MQFNSPIKFAAALQSREVKSLLPTNLSSSELSMLDVATRERSTFSARTLSASYLQAIEDKVRKILNPKTEIRGEEHGDRAGEPYTVGLDWATAKLELNDLLDSLGYVPEKPGTIEDLSSDQRIQLVVKTNVEMAQGYGQWRQGQDETILDAYPASELYRAESRKEPRDWETLWPEACSTVGDDLALSAFQNSGRMVARKDSEVWTEISDFGQPYPPFKFGSGMWVKDVDREDAVALGLIGEDEHVTPQTRGFDLEKEAA